MIDDRIYCPCCQRMRVRADFSFKSNGHLRYPSCHACRHPDRGYKRARTDDRYRQSNPTPPVGPADMRKRRAREAWLRGEAQPCYWSKPR